MSLNIVLNLPCPCCEGLLAKTHSQTGVVVWCPHEDCPSEITDNGAMGPNEEQAYATLCERYWDAETKELPEFSPDDLREMKEAQAGDREHDRRAAEERYRDVTGHE